MTGRESLEQSRKEQERTIGFASCGTIVALREGGKGGQEDSEENA
jgi:hypothetical protein